MKTNYENRVTAFIDILGFKELLAKSVNGKDDVPSEIEKIQHAYNSIRDVWDLDRIGELNRVQRDRKTVTTFSDCVVISFQADLESEVFHTILEIKWMIMRLAYMGILCRGAVVYGKLIHDDRTLFGPALAEAYILESKAALYPRVILDHRIINVAKKAKSSSHTPEMEAEYVESMLERDSDGMYYIDYFAKAQSELDDPEYGFPDYLEKIGSIIRKGLQASSSPFKADLKVKFRWMKEKYNQVVDSAKNPDFIKLLEEEGKFDLVKFYSELKKISPNQ